uniref:hypothetical protein n=1 Tax=Polynucleobacter sp. TaxID=2029855 RepID=UPI0040484B5C
MIQMSDDDEYTIRNCVFAFKCIAKWEELTPTDDDKVQFCNSCQKEVHLCEDDDELVKSVRLNRCIAICREGDMVMGDLVGRVVMQN